MCILFVLALDPESVLLFVHRIRQSESGKIAINLSANFRFTFIVFLSWIAINFLFKKRLRGVEISYSKKRPFFILFFRRRDNGGKGAVQGVGNGAKKLGFGNGNGFIECHTPGKPGYKPFFNNRRGKP